MGQTHLAANAGPDVFESLSCADEAVLQRAIAKLVSLGRQVAVGPEEMISLLESGMDVVELVEYLSSRRREQT
jgi:hypothetical protein